MPISAKVGIVLCPDSSPTNTCTDGIEATNTQPKRRENKWVHLWGLIYCILLRISEGGPFGHVQMVSVSASTMRINTIMVNGGIKTRGRPNEYG